MYRADNLNCDYPQNFKSLKIENISVISGRNQPIIENFNFQIHEGQKILIVGETDLENQHSLTLYWLKTR